MSEPKTAGEAAWMARNADVGEWNAAWYWERMSERDRDMWEAAAQAAIVFERERMHAILVEACRKLANAK